MATDTTFDPIAALEEMAKRQKQETGAQRLVETARAKVILDKDPKRCFFKIVSLQLDAQPDWEIETAAVDGKTIRYNPEFISGLTPQEAMGVLCGHEPLHCAFGHHARRAKRDPSGWNIAADLAVNQVCKEAGFSLPKEAMFPGEGEFKDFPPDLSAEEYYAMLPDDKKDGSGQGDDPGGCGGVVDPSPDESGKQASSQRWERVAAQAADVAQRQGKGSLPGALAKLVDQILHPKVDWRDVLRDFVSRVFDSRDDYCWAFPNRRYMTQGLYVPGLRSESLGHIVVAVDTSGSVSDEMLAGFAGELNGVLEARPCKVSVVYCDAHIHKVVDWTPSEGPMPLEAVGRGGTSHRPVFEWVDEQEEAPACVIALTDLYTAFPDMPPAYPVLWAVPEGQGTEAPFGRVMVIE